MILLSHKQYIECLAMREKILGVEDPSYLTTKHNIAHTFKRMGQYKKALDQYNECLESIEKTLGVEHHLYFKGKHNIA